MTNAPLTLALDDGAAVTEDEPWVLPDQLSYARAEESVDLMSVCKVASHILYLLSGKRYGVRTETVRPFAGNVMLGWQRFLPYAATAHVAWDYRLESAAPPESFRLKSPVQSISQVKLDGVVLTTSDYYVYNQRMLVRAADATNGQRFWPLTQRLDLPDTEKGTFSVTYRWGVPVPEGGKFAAQIFATELAKYVNKDNSALPDRLVSVTRQGISQTMLDPSQFVNMGRTGLYGVDIWLGSVNPNGRRSRPRIVGPDTEQRIRPS